MRDRTFNARVLDCFLKSFCKHGFTPSAQWDTFKKGVKVTTIVLSVRALREKEDQRVHSVFK